MEFIKQWIKEHNITEVECFVPDMAGIARGKIMPAGKYCMEDSIRLPESVYIQTVTGEYPEDDSTIHPGWIDMVLQPDANTIRSVPWATEPTAQIIHDGYLADGKPVEISSRYVLRRVLELYENRGWMPVVAPELEFYLVKTNTDPDYPLEPPIGRTGRPETVRQSYSIDAVNEFDPMFEDIYNYCEAQKLEIDTLIHEAGAAQMEINFRHGQPLDLADQVLFFKRTVRETAIRHKIYATFMSKPMENEPGSSMHVHQSIVDRETGKNIFSDGNGKDSALLFAYIAGLQKYLPAAMAFLAPYVNSYRRITRHQSAPINVQWGYDNRTVGFRVPLSAADARRVENRVAGADVNPYLAIAVSLACGYLGIKEQLKPTAPLEGNAYAFPYGLPRNLDGALNNLKECEPLREILGDKFVSAYFAVKEEEYETFFRVIGSWEREYLLLNV